jgi:hypothetical protein
LRERSRGLRERKPRLEGEKFYRGLRERKPRL